MKKGFLFIAATFLLSSFAIAQTKYGKGFKTDKTMDVAGLKKAMDGKEKIDEVVVKGTITEVCQVAGCWVKLKNDAGDDIFVKFKEDNNHHELVVPKDIAGKTAIVYGKASKKAVSVKEQQHFAEDAGASEKEIAKITAPKQTLRIDAVGVIVE